MDEQRGFDETLAELAPEDAKQEKLGVGLRGNLGARLQLAPHPEQGACSNIVDEWPESKAGQQHPTRAHGERKGGGQVPQPVLPVGGI